MKKKDKLVSVVVQAYNSADTIVRTLESVKAQDYEKIELIVTDDKSTDQTIEEVAAWLEKNQERFCQTQLVTAKVNTGIPGSNNRALRHVTGAYAEFLAADDCMAPNAISTYVAYCEAHPNTIPIARVKLFSDDADCDFSSVAAYCERCYAFAALSQKEQYRQLLIQNRIVAPAAAFYPVKILRALKGFDEAYRWMEDYPLNVKLLKKGYRFGLLDRELVCYRISGGSITGKSAAPLKLTEAKMFFREKMWYMIGNGMGWEAVKQSKSWIRILLRRGK
ncbi:MAG: glycosyltransferase [Lachnospiraceae bacterium]|jgi:alpha-1,3-rhamnosyltransferase